MIRILVADDHPIFRDGLITSLEETGAFNVVARAASAPEAISMAARKRPDIALLDLSMPGNGLTAVRAIAAAGTAGHIAMLTVSEDDEDVAEALAAGAQAYILKGVSAADLRRILRSVHEGEAHVTPGLAARVLTLMSQDASQPDTGSPLDSLTKREEDILRLVAKGDSNREIATALSLKEKTVKHYMTTIMSKLHARNRVEAAVMAHDRWGRAD